MFFYFILGLLVGFIILGAAVMVKILQYRREVMILKNTIKRLEELNMERQNYVKRDDKDDNASNQTKIISIA
jgi:hypothetical protein